MEVRARKNRARSKRHFTADSPLPVDNLCCCDAPICRTTRYTERPGIRKSCRNTSPGRLVVVCTQACEFLVVVVHPRHIKRAAIPLF
jgi:hypothetical protein